MRSVVDDATERELKHSQKRKLSTIARQILNNFYFYGEDLSTIKFDTPCYNAEDNSCNFLDLKISIKDGVIRTDLYRKPTDKPRALLPSSAHPTHIQQNIIHSMAFRLL